MSAHDALMRLGRIHGIAHDYDDIWGRRCQVSDASLIALLAALGVRAGTTQEVEDSIRATASARWRTVVPPAVVVREPAAPWRLRMNLLASAANSPLAWCLTLEDGKREESAFATGALNVVESAAADGERFVALEFTLPATAPCGYHHLAILRDGATLGETTFIVVPARCFCPPAVQDDGRVWGAAVQLYAVRSERNWGIGDFTDLATLLGQWGTRGAGVLGVNPLHALFPRDPERASPYSPSSRCFVNVLYLDVEAVPDFAECEESQIEVRSPEFQSHLKTLRDADLVDYIGVANVKLPMLERCYTHFRSRHLAADTPRAQAFRTYQAAQAPALRRPGHVRHRRLRIPRRECRPRRALAAYHARHLHPRQQARRGRALPYRRDFGNARRMAAGAAPLESHERRSQAHARRHRCAVAKRRVPAVPDAARHISERAHGCRGAGGLPETHRAPHAQGGARSQGAYELDQYQRRI